MKDAKNMDSVFSNCTDDELMFDILFDDDETIIEALAGSDAMSKLLAEGLLEEGDDMVGENPDFDYQNDGDASYSEKDAEGTKEVKPEIGGEVGDGKEVSGKENSAEANAHDDKDEAEAIGLNDKQQVKLEDAGEGPLEDDDQAEREGEVSDTAIETEATTIDTLLNMLEESDDPIQDCDDSAQRDGKCTGVSDTEGKNTEVIGAANAGDSKEDPIADPKCPNDGDVRAGADTCVKDTEGVKTHVVGAALESGEEPEDKDVDKEEEVEESMTFSDELLFMLEADEEEPEEGAPEEPTDEKSCKEAVDPITDKDDAEQRAGKNTGVSDTEGKNTEVLGASIVGDVGTDPLVDLDDAEQRSGKAVGNDTEGVKTHVVGAALEGYDVSDELLSMLEADEEEPEEGAPEEPTDEKSCKESSEEADKPEDAPEQSTGEKCCNEADDYLDSLLKDIDDEDEDLIAAIAGGAAVVPNDVKTNGTDNSDIKEAADKISDELIDDQDDKDIEAIEGEDIPAEDPNIDYDYDDDELIDAVISGIDL